MSDTSRNVIRTSIIVAVAGALALAGLTYALIRFVDGSSSGGDDAVRAAYDSAMTKAGVDATMPPEPVALAQVSPLGLHSFEATFTPDEIAALLNVYPYTSSANGADVSLSRVTLQFPAEDHVALRGTIRFGSDAYSARLTAPVAWSATGLSSTGITELRVSGIEPNAAQRSAASTAVVAYFNSLIRAAPGLVVRDARVTPQGLWVTGDAPDAIEHPTP